MYDWIIYYASNPEVSYLGAGDSQHGIRYDRQTLIGYYYETDFVQRSPIRQLTIDVVVDGFGPGEAVELVKFDNKNITSAFVAA